MSARKLGLFESVSLSFTLRCFLHSVDLFVFVCLSVVKLLDEVTFQSSGLSKEKVLCKLQADACHKSCISVACSALSLKSNKTVCFQIKAS